jgi:hypothetical protein
LEPHLAMCHIFPSNRNRCLGACVVDSMRTPRLESRRKSWPRPRCDPVPASSRQFPPASSRQFPPSSRPVPASSPPRAPIGPGPGVVRCHTFSKDGCRLRACVNNVCGAVCVLDQTKTPSPPGCGNIVLHISIKCCLLSRTTRVEQNIE